MNDITENCSPDLPVDLLGIGAHPDDVEIASGGLFLAMAKSGFRCAILDLTRGEAATRGSAEIRLAEAKRAGEVLQLVRRVNLGLPDSSLTADIETRGMVAAEIRKLRPRFVVAPYWRDAHPDHVAASAIVKEASFIAGLRRPDIMGEPHRPEQILYTPHRSVVGFTPTLVVDTTELMDGKLAAISCYESQLYKESNDEPSTRISSSYFLEYVKAKDRIFGDMIGVRYGEGYVSMSPLSIHDPTQLFEHSPGRVDLSSGDPRSTEESDPSRSPWRDR